MKEEITDLQLQVSLYSQETKRLEKAHIELQKQFESMRSKFEASHQTLEQVVAHMSDGLLFITAKGIVSLFNPAAARILDVSQDKILNTPYWEHFSDTLFGFPLANALKNGRTPGRVLLSLSNGREIEAAPSFIPEKGLLLLLTDRTEIKQLETTVQQNERLKELGEMAATLAHEIRNPLGGIEGFASLLKREVTEPSHTPMIEAILEGSRTLNMLVSNVLEYARPLFLHFEPTDMAVFLDETAALAKASGYNCQVRMEKNCTLSIDPRRMQLVLLNLIRNAIEAHAAKVELVFTHDKTLQIIDEGEGIAKEHLEKIFTPFFTTKTTGTGLGLPEAYKVMQAHGGSILVDSKVGKGTCMTLKYGN